MSHDQLANRSVAAAPRLVPVSNEELSLVEGGSIWGAIKGAAKWVYNHVYVDLKNHVIGVKGTN